MNIRMLVMDVDGTLTDGRIYIGSAGEVMKAFHAKDGYILARLSDYNIIPVIITGRTSEIIVNRCSELGITEVYQGVSDKVSMLRSLSKKHGLSLDEIAYIGDDNNDLDCIRLCGFCGCPSDASDAVKSHVHYICQKKGGEGAVREFIEYLILLTEIRQIEKTCQSPAARSGRNGTKNQDQKAQRKDTAMRQKIEKGCGETENFRLNIGYFDRARDAFGSVLDTLSIKSGDHLLLPSYIGWSAREGSGIFDPVHERGIRPVFYALDGNLSIDLDDVMTKLKTANAKAILLVHYFGFADARCAAIAGAAKKLGIPVIEDAAHALLTDLIGGGCGRLGDYTLYSLHKMLPHTSGGMLLTNGESPMPKEAAPVCRYGDPFRYDLRRIAESRIEHYNLITRCLIAEAKPDLVLPLYETLPLGTIPQTYPVLLPYSDRDAVYQAMNDLGWGVVSLYHSMVSAIDPIAFHRTQKVSRHILNLPVHQDVDASLVPNMIKDLMQAVETYGSLNE